MIDKTIVNQMTAIELRNYVDFLSGMVVKQQNMIQTQDELITALLNLYNQESRKYDAQIEMDAKASVLSGFQREMVERYTEPAAEPCQYAPDDYAEFVRRAEDAKSNCVHAGPLNTIGSEV